MSNEAFQQALESISAEYRSGLPARMLELDSLWTAVQSTQQPPEALRRALHSIAGSARTFGMSDLGAAARAAEQLLDPCCERGESLPANLRADFDQLLNAVRNAAHPRRTN